MAIITISRQVGSLGDEIAQALAERTGYRLIGHDDFHQLAQKYNPEFSDKLKRFEKEQGPGFFERLFFSTPVYLSLYEALIFELAGRRRVIILGRGAQIVLRDIHQVYRVRVVAPIEQRVNRVSLDLGLSQEEALDFVRKYDHRRRALIRQVYEQEPTDWSLYDMALNTVRLDVTAGAAIIQAAVEEVKRLQPLEEATSVLEGLALGKRVEAKLRDEFHGREITVKGAPDGCLELTGAVTSQNERKQVEEFALTQPGVTKIINNLRSSYFAYGH